MTVYYKNVNKYNFLSKFVINYFTDEKYYHLIITVENIYQIK